MPSDPRAALSSLLRAAHIEDHDEILEAASVAIAADPADDAARHTKVVALLKLDRFDDALRLIDGNGSQSLQALCALEKAYALYKVGRLPEANDLLRAAGDAIDDEDNGNGNGNGNGNDNDTDSVRKSRTRSTNSRRSMRHVAAQVAYRAERFDDARRIYAQMLDADPASSEANDLRINAIAAAAQAEWHGAGQGTGSGLQRETPDTFEACYNLASEEMARGSLAHAAQLLRRAAILCDNSDELDDDEKQTELRPIRAQQAYILAAQGKSDEALEIYQSLGPATENDGKDFDIITQSNLLALEPPSGNPYLRQRKNENMVPSFPAGKLFTNQTQILQRNKLVIDLQAKKVSGVRNRTSIIRGLTQQPCLDPHHNSISALNAAAEVDGLGDRESLRRLLLLASRRPNDIGLALTIVQLQIQQQQPSTALAFLEAFLARLEGPSPPSSGGPVPADPAALDARFGPGIVALAVTLYRSQHREAAAKAELIKAAKHWHTRPARAASTLLLAAGVELMRSSAPEDLALAGASFEKLFAEHRGSSIASAGLVASFAASSTTTTTTTSSAISDPSSTSPNTPPSEASNLAHHSAQLPPVESLISGIDIDSLLASGVASLGPPTAPLSRKRPADADAGDNRSSAQQKRRRRKLPKSYVQGKTPDPERWLPLRDRSSYRPPKGRKGKKKAAEATQGGFVKDEGETLELVGGGGVVKVEKASGGSAAASKKKKKGKK